MLAEVFDSPAFIVSLVGLFLLVAFRMWISFQEQKLEHEIKMTNRRLLFKENPPPTSVKMPTPPPNDTVKSI